MGAYGPQSRARYLVVEIGGVEFALPLECVEEIRAAGSVAEPDPAWPFLRGSLGIRGESVPVLDTGTLLGLESSIPIEAQALLVLRGSGRRGAALVDRALEVLDVAGDAVEPVQDRAPVDPAFLLGHLPGGRRLPVLDAGRLVRAAARGGP